MKLRRRPTLSVHRWLMLVGLALSFVLQPMLASVGELHELAHDVVSAHGTVGTDASEPEGDDAGTLHQIHHLAHCCGNMVMAAVAPFALAAIDRDEPTNQADSQFVPDGQWLAPFRPPITA